MPFLALAVVRLPWEFWLSMSPWAEMMRIDWSWLHLAPESFLPTCCSVERSEAGRDCCFSWICLSPVIKFWMRFWSVFFFKSLSEDGSTRPTSYSYSTSEFFERPTFSKPPFLIKFLELSASDDTWTAEEVFGARRLFLKIPSYFVYKFEKSDVVTYP